MAFCGRWTRRQAVGVRGRDGHPHLAGSFVWLLASRAEGLFQSAKNQGYEYYAAFEHELGGDGHFYGYRRPTNKEVFEAYMEHFLAPTLKEGQIVVMANLSAHKGRMVRKLIEDRGCQLLCREGVYSRKT